MKNKPGFAHIILIIVVAAAFVGVVIFGLSKSSNSLPTSQATPTSEAVDEMSDWEIYTDTDFDISFNYPPDWEKLSKDNNRTEFEDSAIVKDLPADSVNPEYCTRETDCYPITKITLTTLDTFPSHIKNPTNPGWRIKEGIINDLPYISIYYSEDAPYPIITYFDLPSGSALQVDAYLPSHTNCQGSCPVYEDSNEIIKVGQEIDQILSTFEFTN